MVVIFLCHRLQQESASVQQYFHILLIRCGDRGQMPLPPAGSCSGSAWQYRRDPTVMIYGFNRNLMSRGPHIRMQSYLPTSHGCACPCKGDECICPTQYPSVLYTCPQCHTPCIPLASASARSVLPPTQGNVCEKASPARSVC